MTVPALSLLGLLTLAPAAAQVPPAIPAADAVRIAEGFRLADALGNKVWPDWDRAPFAVLLVTPDHEFLVRHPKPSDDFKLVGEDAVLKQKVWVRKRTFSTQFLATFPAVSGVTTIVVGQAENTESKTSSRWVITLLHEHFHQLQYTQPRYYPDVDALGLARGDQTGMWMLNYPFPYTTPEVRDHFSVLCKALGDTLAAREKPDFAEKLTTYVAAKKKFREMVKPDDYKYFAFQTWQEGIARYTEYHLATLAAAEYEPSQAFRELKDYVPFKDVARTILSGIEKEMAAVRLDQSKRTVVYNYGAAEGLVLDRARPGWRKRYFEDRFTLDRHFAPEK